MSDKDKYVLIVDLEDYKWQKKQITGLELRNLAGIPDGAQIFEHITGKPDVEILNDTVVHLEKHHGPVKFSTQSPGSQAG